jgi:hypothetical protein
MLCDVVPIRRNGKGDGGKSKAFGTGSHYLFESAFTAQWLGRMYVRIGGMGMRIGEWGYGYETSLFGEKEGGEGGGEV